MPGAKGRSGGKRSGAGRPTYKASDADRYTVQVLRACGITHETIAKCLGVALGTLSKHYKSELESAGEAVIAKVAEGVVRRALNGDNTCSIFFLKTRAGWRDAPQRVEHTGENGKPINLSGMSTAQLNELEKILTVAASIIENYQNPNE